MASGRSDRSNDPDDDTPKTRSYVDALLRGNMSEEQLERLRAEIASPEDAISAPPRTSPPGPRTVPPRISEVPSSPRRARPPTDDARTVVRTWPPTAEPLIEDVDPHDARTVARSWPPVGHSPSTQPPGSQPVSSRPPVELSFDMDEDEHTARTVARSWPVPAPSEPPEEPPPISFPLLDFGAPPELPNDEDDQLTAVRSSPPISLSLGPNSLPGVTEREHEEPRAFGRAPFPTLDLTMDSLELGPLDLGSPPSSKPKAKPAGELLEQTYLSSLGGAAAVPRLAITPDKVKALPLGPEAAFVLSQIDGMCSVDDIIDISGFPRGDTLHILYDLLQKSVIKVGK